MLSCPFSPDRPADESSLEHPAKRLKVEPTDMVSEADITSLKKPNLDLIWIVSTALATLSLGISWCIIRIYQNFPCRISCYIRIYQNFPCRTSCYIRIYARHKFSINNSVEMISNGEGDCLFLAAKAKNQFLALRELLLGIARSKLIHCI